jgi:phospholipid transport system transporter-binding protein
LRAVTRADSAGLALMVEWLREARRRGGRLEVVNMPDQMFGIAHMSKLDRVLLGGED